MVNNQPGYVTKDDLRQLNTDLRQGMRELLSVQTDLFRDELDSKLGVLEARVNDRFTAADEKLMAHVTMLMAHTEEVVGSHAVELLENIANVIDPEGTDMKGWKYQRFPRT